MQLCAQTAPEPKLTTQTKIRSAGPVAAITAAPEHLHNQGSALTALLESAVRLTAIGCWTSSVPLGRLNLSWEAAAIFGFAGGAFDGRFATWFAGIHPDDQRKFPNVEAEVRAGRRTFSYEYRFTTPAGVQKRLKTDGEALLDERGELVKLAGTVMEVPDLESQRNAVTSLAGQIPDPDTADEFAWEQDKDFRFVSLSGTSRLPVAELQSVVGLCRWELPNAVPLSSTWSEHIELLKQQRPFRAFEYRFGSGAQTLFVSSSGDPVLDAAGRLIGYRGVGANITRRVVAAEEAKQNSILLEHASRIGKFGAWALRVPEMEVSWSKASRALLGYANDVQLSWRQALSHLDEDGRHAVQTAVQTCVADGAEFNIEVRAVSAQGTPLWLRMAGEGERDVMGPVRRVLGSIQDISAQKDSERRVEELSERLANTLESITEGFVTLDRQWRITYVNRAAEKMWNRSRLEMLGLAVSEMFPSFGESIFYREFRRALAEQRTVQFEGYAEPLGAWLEVYAYPSLQGLAVCCQDVTEQKTAREAMLASEERHRMLFETALDATLQTTADGEILAANPAACSMFGLSEAELCSRGREGILALDDPRLQRMLHQLDATQRCLTPLTLVRGDGSRFEAEVSAARYGASGGKMFSVVVARDITQRLRQQAEIRALNDSLVQQVRERTSELERANGELKGFARSLAHDLRQPIAAAKAFGHAWTRAMSEGKLQEARNNASQVLSTVKTMGAYVEALLSLAQISQVSLELEEVDLGAIANSLLDQLQAQAPDRRLLRRVKTGMYAEGDATLLRMLLQNLIGNAWKFTARKEVTKILFTSEEADEGRVVYCVRDNGAGFDMALANKLFGTFQRLHSSSEFPGTGIGLANAQRIVARHGGLIWAKSAPGDGARFYFTLGRPCGPQSRLLSL